mmetsp:Transcript_80863/g.214686  ORF Transcript_80863/g.214686 Transcript_80863/m.214686 type:complete len:353 (-) Transcript_80863:77-1135(-)
MVLLLKGHLVILNAIGVDQVLDRLETGAACPRGTLGPLGIVELLDLVEELHVLGVVGCVQRGPDGRLVPHRAELLVALGVEVAKVGVEGVALLALLLGAEVRVQGVDGDEHHAEVGVHAQDVAHDLSGRAPEAHAEAVEVLEPGLLQRRLHQLEVLLREDAAHLRGLHVAQAALTPVVLLLHVLLKVGANGGVHQEDAVNVIETALDVKVLRHDRLHVLEDSQGVDLLEHIHGLLVVQRPLDDHADVVDHLLPRNEVHERRQRLDRLRLHVPELVGELLVALPRDGGHEEGGRLILQEGAVVRLLQGAPHVLEGVRGAEAPVVLHAQEATAQATEQGLAEAVVDVEPGELHA